MSPGTQLTLIHSLFTKSRTSGKGILPPMFRVCPLVSVMEITSQTQAEVCLPGDSKFYQVETKHQPSHYFNRVSYQTLMGLRRYRVTISPAEIPGVSQAVLLKALEKALPHPLQLHTSCKSQASWLMPLYILKGVGLTPWILNICFIFSTLSFSFKGPDITWDSVRI